MSDKLIPSYHPLVGKIDIGTFLQKLNISNKRDIEMFISLTKYDSPIIPYKQALAMTKTSNDEFSFNSFIQRMENSHVGILRKSISGDILIPDYVRLCDDDAPIFYCEYISELTNYAYLAPDKNLPTRRQFKILGYEIPKEIAVVLDINHIQKAFKNEGKKSLLNSDSIYALKLPRNEILYCTQYSIPKLAELCIERLKLAFMDSKIIPNIAKNIGMNLTEAREKIERNDLVAWDDFINQCHSALPRLQDNPNTSAYTDIFDYITILNLLIKPKLLQEQSNLQIKQDINNFQVNALHKIYESTSGIPTEKLHDFLEKVAVNSGIQEEEVISTSIDQFFSGYIFKPNDTNTKKLSYDSCIIIDGTCYHSKIIFNIITENFSKICSDLRSYYTGLLKKYLENKLSLKDNPFLNEENLEISVHHKVAELEPTYAILLKNPVLLANILTQKQSETSNSAFANMPKSRKLSLFFNLRTKNLLPWHKIFNINLALFTEDAYNKIGTVNRFWMIFTGRYRAMTSKLHRLQKMTSVMEADPVDVINFHKTGSKKIKKAAIIKAR